MEMPAPKKRTTRNISSCCWKTRKRTVKPTKLCRKSRWKVFGPRQWTKPRNRQRNLRPKATFCCQPERKPTREWRRQPQPRTNHRRQPKPLEMPPLRCCEAAFAGPSPPSGPRPRSAARSKSRRRRDRRRVMQRGRRWDIPAPKMLQS